MNISLKNLEVEIFALLCTNGTQSIVENSERLPPESMMKIGQTLNQKGGLVCYAELHPNDGFDGSMFEGLVFPHGGEIIIAPSEQHFKLLSSSHLVVPFVIEFLLQQYDLRLELTNDYLNVTEDFIEKGMKVKEDIKILKWIDFIQKQKCLVVSEIKVLSDGIQEFNTLTDGATNQVEAGETNPIPCTTRVYGQNHTLSEAEDFEVPNNQRRTTSDDSASKIQKKEALVERMDTRAKKRLTEEDIIKMFEENYDISSAFDTQNDDDYRHQMTSRKTLFQIKSHHQKKAQMKRQSWPCYKRPQTIKKYVVTIVGVTKTHFFGNVEAYIDEGHTSHWYGGSEIREGVCQDTIENLYEFYCQTLKKFLSGETNTDISFLKLTVNKELKRKAERLLLLREMAALTPLPEKIADTTTPFSEDELSWYNLEISWVH
ncbi:hypothetical protein QYM36_002231, partial [Artemia franciscana]